VEELLPAAKFKILLENGQIIIGHLAGKMRLHRIHLLPGDEVRVQVSPYDLKKGRIIYRFKEYLRPSNLFCTDGFLFY